MPLDVQWGIAGKVPVAALADAQSQLPEPLPTDGSKIVSGNDGMSVLLVYEDSAASGEQLASRLSRAHRTPIYLLDFHEYGLGICEYRGTRGKWRDEQHPAVFLQAYGITPPVHERWEPSPIIEISVIEGATLEQARSVRPEAEELFAVSSRGVLVRGGTGFVAYDLMRALECREYTISYDPDNKRFLCVISTPLESGWLQKERFSLGEWPTLDREVIDIILTATASDEDEDGDDEEDDDPGPPDDIIVDSILGETTIDGILRVLDIPRSLLFPD
ncbi:MAG TPA: hypothetical protein VNO30_25955 [Kofleriaceae bacterium]|nr:hypothetical protein [Kofleriaceae bacterium]